LQTQNLCAPSDKVRVSRMSLFQPVNPTVGPNYQAVSWQGNNNAVPMYAAVGLVGITVTQANASGSGTTIPFDPAAMVDPPRGIANPFTAKPAGTQSWQLSGTIITTFTGARLTQ